MTGLQSALGQSEVGLEDKLAVNFGFNLGAEYQSKYFSASGFPSYMRTVRKHPDDSDNSPVEIEDNALNMNPLIKIPLPNLSVKYYKDPITINAGVNVDYVLGPFSYDGPFGKDIMMPDDLIQEYNYIAGGGESRGEGAALVYYDLSLRNPIRFMKHFIPELYVRFSKKTSKKIELFINYQITTYGMTVENGWDRYNALKAVKSYELANVVNQNVLAGLRLILPPIDDGKTGQHLDFYIGYNNSIFRMTQISKEIQNIETYPNGFFIGFTTGFDMNFIRLKK